MSIWIYQDLMNKPPVHDMDRTKCLFCDSRLRILESETYGDIPSTGIGKLRELKACPICGWWCHYEHRGPDRTTTQVFGAYAQLKQFDLVDIVLNLNPKI